MGPRAWPVTLVLLASSLCLADSESDIKKGGACTKSTDTCLISGLRNCIHGKCVQNFECQQWKAKNIDCYQPQKCFTLFNERQETYKDAMTHCRRNFANGSLIINKYRDSTHWSLTEFKATNSWIGIKRISSSSQFEFADKTPLNINSGSRDCPKKTHKEVWCTDGSCMTDCKPKDVKVCKFHPGGHTGYSAKTYYDKSADPLKTDVNGKLRYNCVYMCNHHSGTYCDANCTDLRDFFCEADADKWVPPEPDRGVRYIDLKLSAVTHPSKSKKKSKELCKDLYVDPSSVITSMLPEPKEKWQNDIIKDITKVNQNTKKFYLGITKTSNTPWQWDSDGSDINCDESWCNWKSDKPKTDGGDCVVMDTDGTWRAESCTTSDLAIVCQEGIPVPTPTTAATTTTTTTSTIMTSTDILDITFKNIDPETVGKQLDDLFNRLNQNSTIDSDKKQKLQNQLNQLQTSLQAKHGTLTEDDKKKIEKIMKILNQNKNQPNQTTAKPESFPTDPAIIGGVAAGLIFLVIATSGFVYSKCKGKKQPNQGPVNPAAAPKEAGPATIEAPPAEAPKEVAVPDRPVRPDAIDGTDDASSVGSGGSGGSGASSDSTGSSPDGQADDASQTSHTSRRSIDSVGSKQSGK